MELNWELCRIFYQVARCRNFSRAAAMLFTSQPAVSRSMAALERDYEDTAAAIRAYFDEC